MRRRLLALACAALLASALGAAGAEAREAELASDGLDWSDLQQGLDLESEPSPLRAAPDPMRVLPVSRRAEAPGFAGVKLWASGMGYAFGRRSTGYGLQGGAAIELDEGIDLTAGYRITGFALGDRLDAQLGDVEDRDAAPFVGVDIAF